LRVWLINQYAGTRGSPGGNRPFSLARALVSRGHDVLIITGTFSHLTREDQFPGTNWTYGLQEVDGVRFLWIHSPPYHANDLRRAANMLAFSRRVLQLADSRRAGRPDVIIGSSPHLLAPLAAERLAARYRVPFVMEIRDIWPASLVDLMGLSETHPVVLVLRGLERYLCKRASQIVSTLPGCADHLAGLGVDTGRVTWIPNGVDFSVVPDVSDPPGGSCLTLMYAGSHGVSDGLDVMIRAVALLEAGEAKGRVRWRFVGDGPEKSRLMARVKQQQLRNVSFEDPVPKTEIYRRLAEADAFVVNVRDEPLYRFGVSFNKFYDYLAMGRPTIVGLASPWNPFRESGGGLTVRPDDADDFAGGVLQVVRMSDPERRAMGLRGRVFVERAHDFGKLGGDLERVLERAVHGV
jgi:glycosyltransferase involved in cell wall biosynthesis